MVQKHVVIVGGGFAGLSCAANLIRSPHIHLTLIDKNNYHKFTPFLYQVATSALSAETVASSFRQYFKAYSNIDIKMAQAISIDPKHNSVLTAEGQSYSGDFLVLAAGSTTNFLHTKGAQQYTFPLYNLVDAERLRSRILGVFEDADCNPDLINQGALNFVIVGAGATGTELAGAISDMLNIALPSEFKDLAVKKARVYLVDHSPTILASFSKESQQYAEKVLKEQGIQLKFGLLVDEVTDSYVLLSNQEKILTKTVIWAGGIKAVSLASSCGLPQDHGERVNTRPDLTVEGFRTLYVLGDMANTPTANGKPLPQLAAIAKQAGEWAAKNIKRQIAGKEPIPFQYKDKGIMAMIGKNSAVVELGEKRRILKGFLAYITWLGVHAALLSTVRQRVVALVQWSLGYFSRMPALQILDRTDAARIDWNKNSKNK